jgi:hypothetical protein
MCTNYCIWRFDTETRLRRFWLNILDRNSIANAKIAGLPEDLHMSNGDYNNCLLIFYAVSCAVLRRCWIE